MRYKRTSLVLGLILVMAGAFLVWNFVLRVDTTQNSGYETMLVSFEDTVFEMWIADTPIKRSRGLAQVANLSSDKGMLFVFEELSNYPFWMKDMFIDIDILWLNDQKEVVYIKEKAQPEDYPDSYIPEAHALYVIEIQGGLVEELSIEVGDTFVW